MPAGKLFECRRNHKCHRPFWGPPHRMQFHATMRMRFIQACQAKAAPVVVMMALEEWLDLVFVNRRSVIDSTRQLQFSRTWPAPRPLFDPGWDGCGFVVAFLLLH